MRSPVRPAVWRGRVRPSARGQNPAGAETLARLALACQTRGCRRSDRPPRGRTSSFSDPPPGKCAPRQAGPRPSGLCNAGSPGGAWPSDAPSPAATNSFYYKTIKLPFRSVATVARIQKNSPKRFLFLRSIDMRPSTAPFFRRMPTRRAGRCSGRFGLRNGRPGCGVSRKSGL